MDLEQAKKVVSNLGEDFQKLPEAELSAMMNLFDEEMIRMRQFKRVTRTRLCEVQHEAFVAHAKVMPTTVLSPKSTVVIPPTEKG